MRPEFNSGQCPLQLALSGKQRTQDLFTVNFEASTIASAREINHERCDRLENSMMPIKPNG
jgi:hypothetical protein